jgi:hypothetical protein
LFTVYKELDCFAWDSEEEFLNSVRLDVLHSEESNDETERLEALEIGELEIELENLMPEYDLHFRKQLMLMKNTKDVDFSDMKEAIQRENL